MSIVAADNKEMLFELLKSIGLENNFVLNQKELLNFITQRCNYYHTNRYEFDFGRELNRVNKKIISEGYNFVMSNQPRKKAALPKQESLMSKREIFEVGLANQEAQFKKMINPKKPKEIDFTDGSEDFPIQNLGQIMNQTLADRQRELETITQKYSTNDKEKAQKWLNREKDDSPPKIKIENASNLKLENTITSLTDDTEKKRVRFSIDEKQNNDNPNGLNKLFLKLKQKKPASNSDIIRKLDTIISNQEKILQFLEKKEPTLELEAI